MQFVQICMVQYVCRAVTRGNILRLVFLGLKPESLSFSAAVPKLASFTSYSHFRAKSSQKVRSFQY